MASMTSHVMTWRAMTSHVMACDDVARDDVAMERAHAAMKFMAPEVRCLTLPAWDCLPYDRVSPRPAIIGARLAALTALLDGNRTRGTVVLTTVSAALQRVMPRETLADTTRRLEVGGHIDPADLKARPELKQDLAAPWDPEKDEASALD